jgi:hypothetical protein
MKTVVTKTVRLLGIAILVLSSVIFLYSCDTIESPETVPAPEMALLPEGVDLQMPLHNVELVAPAGAVHKKVPIDVFSWSSYKELSLETVSGIVYISPKNAPLNKPVTIKLGYDLLAISTNPAIDEYDLVIYWLPDFNPKDPENPQNFIIKEELESSSINTVQCCVSGLAPRLGAFMIAPRQNN